MKPTKETILELLNKWLETEKLLRSIDGLMKTRRKRDNQDGRISGIELCISWIENDIS